MLTSLDDTTIQFTDYTNEQGYYSIEITETGFYQNNANNMNFRLLQNYPNPFNHSTIICYELKEPSDINIDIYNVLGVKIKTLVNGFQNKGFNQVKWDGTNDKGNGVSAGLYFYSMTNSNQRITRKMILNDGKLNDINSSNQYLIKSSKRIISKTISNNYCLEVSGEDIAPYEEEIIFEDNLTYNIIVFQCISDIDGNIYKIVKIGNQWWTAENLKVTHYRNGDAIPNITSKAEWSNLTSGAYCAYENNEEYVCTYGYLYNWYAVDDNRNIAPLGWHVPSDDEWKKLEMFLGMSKNEVDDNNWRGTDEGNKLKAKIKWNGNNESSFSALPSGARDGISLNFLHLSDSFFCWTSTKDPHNNNYVWTRRLSINTSKVGRHPLNKKCGISIRLIKD